MKGYLWAAASILLVTAAQLLMKWGMVQLPLLQPDVLWTLGQAGRGAIIAVVMGGAGYVLSMACWFMALRTLPLSRAYPLLSLSYVLVYLAAVLLPGFDENISLWKSSGIVLILLGVWLIHQSPAHARR